MIRVELLPAKFGDCILVGWGNNEIEHWMLIDAGLKATYRDTLLPRLKELAKATGNPLPFPLELLVVTHIDRDHIRGILPLLSASPRVVTAKDIWFNGYKHLDDTQGVADGEELGRLLEREGLPWNESFAKSAVHVDAQDPTRTRSIAGASITILSPYRENLEALGRMWGDELGNWDHVAAEDIDAGAASPLIKDDTLGKRPPPTGITVTGVVKLRDDPFEEDNTKPNGSSIAFIFEYTNRRILFAADAHPSIIERSLRTLSPNGRFPFSAVKLSHHGSRRNLSPELLEKLDCRVFLVSSDGSSYGHPDPETIARLVERPNVRVCFNHRSPYTTVWDDEQVKAALEYEVEYPRDAVHGHVLELE